MLLKRRQIDSTTKTNIMLLVSHDLNRYDDTSAHLQRTAKSDSVPGVSSNQTVAGDDGHGDGDSHHEDYAEEDLHEYEDEYWPEEDAVDEEFVKTVAENSNVVAFICECL